MSSESPSLRAKRGTPASSLFRFGWSLLLAVTLSLASSGPAAAETTDQAAATLLVRLENAAKYIGSPKVCEEPDETGEIPLCLMELYEAKAVVLRNFGGAMTPRRITIRFTAHSFYAVWKERVRFLVIVEPFEDQGRKGLFARYWDWERHGKFCVGQDFARENEKEPIGKLYASGRLEVTKKGNRDWLEGSKVVCVSGREKLPI